MVPSLILLAALGQCPPGVSCPRPVPTWRAPAFVPSYAPVIAPAHNFAPAPVAPALAEHTITDRPTGRTLRVRGWVDAAGVVRYDLATGILADLTPRPAPASNGRQTAPAPEPAPKPIPKPATAPAPAPAVAPPSAPPSLPTGVDLLAMDGPLVLTNDPGAGSLLGIGPELGHRTKGAGGLIDVKPQVTVALPDLVGPALILCGGLALAAVLFRRRPAP